MYLLLMYAKCFPKQSRVRPFLHMQINIEGQNVRSPMKAVGQVRL